MIRKEFPILEFDEDKNAFIRPSNTLSPADVPERCVLCFFDKSIEKLLVEYPGKVINHFVAASLRLPLYELNYKGERIALMQAGVGAPVAGAQLDELSALGCKKFIVCGMCGVLQDSIPVGHLLIPEIAVRDEGTSYHYIEPSREVVADERIIQVIADTLSESDIPFIKVKTWTTDAFYRETPGKIKLRKSEGCATVEMETSAYIAVAQYNNVAFGQILCAGDSLAGDVWDSRGYSSREDVMDYVLKLTLDACIRM